MAHRGLATMISHNLDSGHTLCISAEGELYSFGANDYGALGREQEDDEESISPGVIPSLKNITAVAGSEHTICLDNEGNVFSFGRNSSGELGLGIDEKCVFHPQKIDLPPIKQISCGEDFTMCVSITGDLYSFGNNSSGQLGVGNTKSCNTPQKIDSLKDIDFVECGLEFTICKTLDNSFYGWGDNRTGQLGISKDECFDSPNKIEGWPSDCVDIKCGFRYTVVLTSSQEVFSCGYNGEGQIGRPVDGYFSSTLQKIETLSGITRIECGYNHSLCMDNNDDLFVFGSNEYGQLGLSNSIQQENTPIKHPSLSNIIDISSKGNSSFVKTVNNEIYAFGNNEFAQLGFYGDFYIYSPIRVLEDNEDIWYSRTSKSKAKSARSILPRPSNEEDNSPPKKKPKQLKE